MKENHGKGDWTIYFWVPGSPVGWQRAGRTSKGGRAVIYTQNKTRSYEALIQQHYIDVAERFGHSLTPYDGPVVLYVQACRPIPTSRPEWWKRAAAKHQLGCTTTPDFDNLGKVVGDSLTGLAWVDDRQIIDGRVVKLYDERPGLRIHIKHLPKPIKCDMFNTILTPLTEWRV